MLNFGVRTWEKFSSDDYSTKAIFVMESVVEHFNSEPEGLLHSDGGSDLLF